jgi:hypothetical protein
MRDNGFLAQPLVKIIALNELFAANRGNSVLKKLSGSYERLVPPVSWGAKGSGSFLLERPTRGARTSFVSGTAPLWLCSPLVNSCAKEKITRNGANQAFAKNNSGWGVL